MGTLRLVLLIALVAVVGCADPADRPTGPGDVAPEVDANPEPRLLAAAVEWVRRVDPQRADLTVEEARALTSVRIGRDYETEELAHLARLPALTDVVIWRDGEGRRKPAPRPAPSDADLAELALLPRLRTLRAGGWSAPFTDAGLAHLSEHETLEMLWIAQAQHVTDEGMRHVARMPVLRELNVTYTKIGDVGLEHLLASGSLETVGFGWAAEAAAAKRRFLAKHPDQTLLPVD